MNRTFLFAFDRHFLPFDDVSPPLEGDDERFLCEARKMWYLRA